MSYDCKGRNMPDDEFVACYRAGHSCPPFVAEHSESDTHITISYRCPCCGQHGVSTCTPREWGKPPPIPVWIRAGIVLDEVSP